MKAMSSALLPMVLSMVDQIIMLAAEGRSPSQDATLRKLCRTFRIWEDDLTKLTESTATWIDDQVVKEVAQVCEQLGIPEQPV